MLRISDGGGSLVAEPESATLAAYATLEGPGHNRSNHGEILALIVTSILASLPNLHSSSSSQLPSSSHPSVTIFSDHLQSVHLISDIHSNALPPNFWTSKPAHSFYRCLPML